MTVCCLLCWACCKSWTKVNHYCKHKLHQSYFPIPKPSHHRWRQPSKNAFGLQEATHRCPKIRQDYPKTYCPLSWEAWWSLASMTMDKLQLDAFWVLVRTLATNKIQHWQYFPTYSKMSPTEWRALVLSRRLGWALAGGSQCAAAPALMVNQVVFCIVNVTGTSAPQRVLETRHVIPWHVLCSKLKDISLCEIYSNQTP